MRKIFLLGCFLLLSIFIHAQFHTLTIPQASTKVTETQRLGVTDITIDYHSPTVRGRDVWNDVIPQNGDPIPWRAGANMNTTISFSTDVQINGNDLKAGTYGFHVIPRSDKYTLLFAHSSNLWGSYYLDIEKDITLSIDVQDTICSFSEKLDYEFYPKSENAILIGLEWAEKHLPFTVSVDLNKTVVESFRNELRGINTYRWEAWRDAAEWCYNHNTNLEEALTWTERSISGGYNGFAANKNIDNMTTKARILHKLNRKEDLKVTIEEVKNMSYEPYQANTFSIFLIDIKDFESAIDFCERAAKKHPNTWFIELNLGLSNYFAGNKSKAVQDMKKARSLAPDNFHTRLDEMTKEVEAGTFKLPPRG